jgi:8-oxo-dGTP pyrophosphatase MutT (NUDIX family)
MSNRQSTQPKRVRASVIVEQGNSVLLASTKSGLILLPGGGLNRNELSISAAARELFEETRLIATSLVFLFQYESRSYFHHVFHAKADGLPVAGDDAESLILLVGSVGNSKLNLSPATREILLRFELMQKI